MKLLGRYEHVIDDKGRLAIPAPLRNKLKERSKKDPMFLTVNVDHLELFTADTFEVKANDLESKSDFQPAVQRLRRFLGSGTTECRFDSQGRITIPPFVRDEVPLGQKVTIAGVFDRVEIWNSDLFAQDRERTRNEFSLLGILVDESSRD